MLFHQIRSSKLSEIYVIELCVDLDTLWCQGYCNILFNYCVSTAVFSCHTCSRTSNRTKSLLIWFFESRETDIEEDGERRTMRDPRYTTCYMHTSTSDWGHDDLKIFRGWCKPQMIGLFQVVDMECSPVFVCLPISAARLATRLWLGLTFLV